MLLKMLPFALYVYLYKFCVTPDFTTQIMFLLSHATTAAYSLERFVSLVATKFKFALSYATNMSSFMI
jgi:hypothetical protein